LCRNCLLKLFIQGKMKEEVKGRPGRRNKQLPDYAKEKRRYWKSKEEAIDRTLDRTRIRRL
jgi:hypothetical protein